MKPSACFCAILTCVIGCDSFRQADTSYSPVTIEVERHDPAPQETVPPEPDLASDDGESIEFQLSAAAAAQIRAAIDASPGATHLLVEVRTADKKFYKTFDYQLTVGPEPSRERYALTESHGIPIAITKDDLRFLRGTKVDFSQGANGPAGFVFHNPNDKPPAPAPPGETSSDSETATDPPPTSDSP